MNHLWMCCILAKNIKPSWWGRHRRAEKLRSGKKCVKLKHWSRAQSLFIVSGSKDWMFTNRCSIPGRDKGFFSLQGVQTVWSVGFSQHSDHWSPWSVPDHLAPSAADIKVAPSPSFPPMVRYFTEYRENFIIKRFISSTTTI